MDSRCNTLLTIYEIVEVQRWKHVILQIIKYGEDQDNIIARVWSVDMHSVRREVYTDITHCDSETSFGVLGAISI